MIEPWRQQRVAAHSEMLVQSYKLFTGRDLLPAWSSQARQEPRVPMSSAELLFKASFVVVSHGTEADPVLNYGNATALALWEMNWEELTRTPSRLTAQAPERDERARLLAEVTRNGFIDNYSGIRVSKSGRRFRIEQATVWNLIDANGQPAGQAATFSRWLPL